MALTNLRLPAVRGQSLAEDDGRGGGDPNREVGQDGCEDGPSLLMPANAGEGGDSRVSTELFSFSESPS